LLDARNRSGVTGLRPLGGVHNGTGRWADLYGIRGGSIRGRRRLRDDAEDGERELTRIARPELGIRSRRKSPQASSAIQPGLTLFSGDSRSGGVRPKYESQGNNGHGVRRNLHLILAFLGAVVLQQRSARAAGLESVVHDPEGLMACVFLLIIGALLAILVLRKRAQLPVATTRWSLTALICVTGFTCVLGGTYMAHQGGDITDPMRTLVGLLLVGAGCCLTALSSIVATTAALLQQEHKREEAKRKAIEKLEGGTEGWHPEPPEWVAALLTFTASLLKDRESLNRSR